MKHPNVAVLEKIYAAFTAGDFQGVLRSCSEKVTFQVPGKSALAGKYTRETFPQLTEKLAALSGGSFRLQAHDILASDQHAVVLASVSFVKNGAAVEYRTAHVWRIEQGIPVAWYEYPRDLYAYDASWSE